MPERSTSTSPQAVSISSNSPVPPAEGAWGFGSLTARNYDDYLRETYLQPAATTYLKGLSGSDRSAYLAENTFITWKNGRATFTWADFLTHVGARKKTLPAFDMFEFPAADSTDPMSGDINNEFGTGTTQYRRFTLYSLRHEGSSSARLDSDIPEKLNLMNPMYHLGYRNPGRSKHWWIRVGTKDSDTSLSIVGNLAASARNLGDDVNSLMYWDGGHGANTDPGDFIKSIAKVSGYKK